MRIAILFFFFMYITRLSAQNGDCNTAISVCNNLYEEINSPTGTGAVFEMAPGSCQTGGEFNSSWYVFTIQENGTLSFVLDPNDDLDDYDWSLFNITDNGCAGINSGQSPEVSCNSFGTLFGIPGPTGMSTAMGGSGTSNGPGDNFGPPFNADHPVTVGQTYALVVMNWTGSTNGYSLDFGSANTSIFDNVAPTLVSVENKWCTGEIHLTFSEEVDLAGLTAANFGFLENGYTVTSIEAQSTTTHSHEIILTVNNGALTENTNLTLIMNNNAQLSDLCGNSVVMPLELELIGEFNYTTEATPSCNGGGGILNLTITDNADNGPFAITVNGGSVTSFPMQNLSNGTVIVSITDPNGCTKTSNVEILNTLVSVTLPADLNLCSMNTTLVAEYQGSQIQWQPQDGITFGSPTQGTTLVTASQPIQYTIQVIAQTGSCIDSDEITIQFNIPPVVEVSMENVSCFGACDGRIEVSNAAGNPITIFIDTNTSTGVNPILENVCADSYDMTIVHGPQCFSLYPVNVTQPPEVIASADASATKVSVEEPVVLLTSTSVNAASLEWRLQGDPTVLSTAEFWELELPRVPGIYVVELMAIDINGCTDLTEFSIFVESNFYFFIPNSFTPNNDDVNDVFKVSFADEPVLYELHIYNRYGALVFSTTDWKKSWTGDASGNGQYYCPNGTYSWKIKAKGRHDIEPITYTGHVNIFR